MCPLKGNLIFQTKGYKIHWVKCDSCINDWLFSSIELTFLVRTILFTQ